MSKDGVDNLVPSLFCIILVFLKVSFLKLRLLSINYKRQGLNLDSAVTLKTPNIWYSFDVSK